jgi:hypothetical protein
MDPTSNRKTITGQQSDCKWEFDFVVVLPINVFIFLGNNARLRIGVGLRLIGPPCTKS